MFNNKISRVIIGLIGMFYFVSCSQTDKKGKPLDTPTSGEITIAIDECYKPLIQGEIDTFHALYPRTKLNVIYTTESEAFNLLMKDSVRCIVVPRKINDAETAELKKIPISPRNILIANDAVALIVNNENKDTLITYEKLEQIISGEFTNWNQLSKNSNIGDLNIVFDANGSSTARYLQEKLNKNKPLPKNCFAVKSNAEVIDYVEKNKNALGVIGVNWVSDAEDPMAQSFLKRINVVSISAPDTGINDPEYVKPYQAYIATRQYPLLREVFIVSREARTGLGTGFASFVAGEKGQRIILKSGLLPATAPVRIIQFKK